jgi:hypothetical protein
MWEFAKSKRFTAVTKDGTSSSELLAPKWCGFAAATAFERDTGHLVEGAALVEQTDAGQDRTLPELP